MIFMDFLVEIVVDHDIVIYLGIIRYTLCVYHIWSAVLEGVNMEFRKTTIKIK